MTMLNPEPTSHDFPEDFLPSSQEDHGLYLNTCTRCGAEIMGHKYRRICRVCSEAARKVPTIDPQTKVKDLPMELVGEMTLMALVSKVLLEMHRQSPLGRENRPVSDAPKEQAKPTALPDIDGLAHELWAMSQGPQPVSDACERIAECLRNRLRNFIPHDPA